ncbi:hypothetical protein BV25DRAFT_1921377 [Artomyces pyxidatus]|uniref:Uncharacterized protein n=1 Tax=Artomyces pyxidatus TaxID=48021 RepID=A0ACB8SJK2_9AGAM|nr:hypothetical protein BV25DRAFT_1921377 [Artomyces pyxidatus]
MSLSGSVYVLLAATAAPSNFPGSGNGLWYTSPGTDWTSEYLPVGNGYLAAMVPGGTAQEATQLNIESLWIGGPFQNVSYNGGNKRPEEQVAMANDIQQIRQEIFASPNGTITDWGELSSDAGAYGSYSGAGYLVSTLSTSGDVSDYGRWLDLDSALAHTEWTHGGASFLRTTFCSNPMQACFEHINSSAPSLPTLTYTFSQQAEVGLPTASITCLDDSTLQVRGFAGTPGMAYEILGRVQSAPESEVHCTGGAANATVTVSGAREAWIAWVGGTEYDMSAGDAAHAFSFRGANPHGALLALLGAAAPGGSASTSAAFEAILAQHVADYASAVGAFSLNLGQTPDLSMPTDRLWDSYEVDVGNAYLEWVLFNYGRYLLVGSSRGTLPANLQGKWASELENAWNGDYHANINLQMNYWAAEMTGLNVMKPLFDLMEKTWAPRGAQTAQVLYNISRGWVTHDEMNIFGSTGMKSGNGSAEWADYPESAVWMMLHVWDHFDYTGDVAWWKEQGWPLIKGRSGLSGRVRARQSSSALVRAHFELAVPHRSRPSRATKLSGMGVNHFPGGDYARKWDCESSELSGRGVAEFHLDKLILDDHFQDSTLVVVPCNSPEQAPITFGCVHAQQLIWQLFNAVEKGYAEAGDTDEAFLAGILFIALRMLDHEPIRSSEVRSKRAQMDKGIHIGSWGQLQEWKYDMDQPNDTHRHLSHLVGLYPGYAIASFDPSIQAPIFRAGVLVNYTYADVLGAATTSLVHRGNGTGADADAGWEKLWRAATWAQLANATEFYHELSYAIQRNFGPNLFSRYSPDSSAPFQIDANLGYPAALLNALVQAPDVASYDAPLTVTLLPALPDKWPAGEIKGVRLRGGMALDIQWSGGRLVSVTIAGDGLSQARDVQVMYAGEVVESFRTGSVSTQQISLN